MTPPQPSNERAWRPGPRELSVAVSWRYRVMWLANRLVMRTLFRIRAQGLEHLPAAPYQLVCNHHNGFDPLLVMAICPLTPRITWFGPKEEDFSRGFKNRVMAFFGGVIPYDPQKTRLTSAVRAVRRVFAAGGVLAICAEGRVGFDETTVLPFEEGAAAFAAASQVPIVPCAIIGSSRLWLGRRITIRFGTPVDTAGARDRSGRAALETEAREAVTALLPAMPPRVARVRPFENLLTDLLNGPDAVAERRHLMGRAGQ
jgi:1-acyl-sn-glycerol-3-phosphate acyltransferase